MSCCQHLFTSRERKVNIRSRIILSRAPFRQISELFATANASCTSIKWCTSHNIKFWLKLLCRGFRYLIVAASHDNYPFIAGHYKKIWALRIKRPLRFCSSKLMKNIPTFLGHIRSAQTMYRWAYGMENHEYSTLTLDTYIYGIERCVY